MICCEMCSSMMESTLFGVVIWDDGMVFANQKAASILGYADPKDLMTKSPLEFVHPGDRCLIKEKLASASYRHVVAGEGRFIRKDWSIAFVDMEVFPVSRAGEKPVLLCLFRDVSMRKATEQSQWESEKKYWELLATIPDGVLVFELGDGKSSIGHVDEVNDGLCSMLRYKRSKVLSMDVMDLVDGGSCERALIFFRETMEKGESRFKITLASAEGEAVWAEVSARIVSLWERPVGLWVVRDISSFMDAEGKLADLSDRYKSLFTHLSAGFAIYEVRRDPEGKPWSYRFFEVNEAYEKLIGIPRSRLIGKPVLEAVPDGELLMLPSCTTVLLSGESVRFEHYSASMDRHLDVTVFSPTKSSVAVILYDISSLKKMESLVRQSEKLQALGKLTGGVAHGFSNYLVGIMGCGTTIHEQSTDPSARVIGATIMDMAEKANELIKKLLVFSREEDLSLSPVSLNDMVMDMVSMLEQGWSGPVRLKLVLEDDLPMVVADGAQIYNALMNLVINAVDAMSDGGSVGLSTESVYLDDQAVTDLLGEPKPGHYVRVTVSDQGKGIAPGDIPKIFDPFYSSKPQGTGMGLPAVFGTVKSHGGGIKVESSPGKGSVFSIYLPSGVSVEEFRESRGTEADKILLPDPSPCGCALRDLEMELTLHRPLKVRRALEALKDQGILKEEQLKILEELAGSYLFDRALEELKKFRE